MHRAGFIAARSGAGGVRRGLHCVAAAGQQQQPSSTSSTSHPTMMFITTARGAHQSSSPSPPPPPPPSAPEGKASRGVSRGTAKRDDKPASSGDKWAWAAKDSSKQPQPSSQQHQHQQHGKTSRPVPTPSIEIKYASPDPTKHTSADVNKMYVVGPEVEARVPEGWCGDLRRLLAPMDRSKRSDHWLDILCAPNPLATLVRESTMTVIDKLRTAQTDHKLKDLGSILLDGDSGCGKSMALNHIVHWARESGWLVVFLPQASSFLKANDQYSWTAEGHVVQPVLANTILKAIAKANMHLLNTIKLKSKMPEELAKCQTLEDVVSAGGSSTEMSVIALDVFKAELALLTELPVMIAVDEVNTLSGPSEYMDLQDKRRRPLPATRLHVASLFNGLSPNLANGVFIGAYTRSGLGTTTPTSPSHHRIPPYSRAELECIVRYYSSSEFARVEPRAVNAYVTFLSVFSGGRGRLVHRHAAIYPGVLDPSPETPVPDPYARTYFK